MRKFPVAAFFLFLSGCTPGVVDELEGFADEEGSEASAALALANFDQPGPYSVANLEAVIPVPVAPEICSPTGGACNPNAVWPIAQVNQTTTKIYLPEGSAADRFPFICFAHGAGTSYHFRFYDTFATLLASWGFVVLIPDYAPSSGGETAGFERAGFQRGACAWARAQNNVPGSVLYQRLTASDGIFMGHSWGGWATQANWIRHTLHPQHDPPMAGVILLDQLDLGLVPTMQNYQHFRSEPWSADPSIPVLRIGVGAGTGNGFPTDQWAPKGYRRAFSNLTLSDVHHAVFLDTEPEATEAMTLNNLPYALPRRVEIAQKTAVAMIVAFVRGEVGGDPIWSQAARHGRIEDWMGAMFARKAALALYDAFDPEAPAANPNVIMIDDQWDTALATNRLGYSSTWPAGTTLGPGVFIASATANVLMNDPRARHINVSLGTSFPSECTVQTLGTSAAPLNAASMEELRFEAMADLGAPVFDGAPTVRVQLTDRNGANVSRNILIRGGSTLAHTGGWQRTYSTVRLATSGLVGIDLSQLVRLTICGGDNKPTRRFSLSDIRFVSF